MSAYTSKLGARPFGTLPDGTRVERYTLRSTDIEVDVSTFGARIVSLRTPSRTGEMSDIVLGYDELDGYLTDRYYFGATVGRYANRIAAGRISLGGHTYQLTTNDGGNTLHGGARGFDKRLWQVQDDVDSLVLCYRSPAGEEGFPGAVEVRVHFAVIGHELRIDYEATAAQDTIINLTNHSYFNLTGRSDRPILDHQLSLRSERFTPVDAQLIPTGELAAVAATPFDFRAPKYIGRDIEAAHEQLRLAGGFDHNWALDKSDPGVRLAAHVYEPESGRNLEVLTSEPGMQFYTGNHMDGSVAGKDGRVLGYRCGFCLETQHFPDSPNQSTFPSTFLRAGQTYRSTSLYRFSAEASSHKGAAL